MITMGADRHSTDGDLVALLDGERGNHQRAVEAHVDGCALCSGRLAQLQERSARLSDLLRAVEPAAIDRARLLRPAHQRARGVGPRGSRAVWSRLGVRAAAAVLLLAGVAAASPARGWILDRIVGRGSEPTLREPEPSPPSPTRAARQSAGSIVRFRSEYDELTIRFDVRPAAGTLVIVGGEDARSSAQIVSGAHGEAFLVLPSEIRIRNTVRSAADYEIVLAPTVRRVRVTVSDASGSALATLDVTPRMRRSIGLGRRGDVR